MTTTEKFTFFWNGTFSQWKHSPFTLDGVKYNCAEQYMMQQKALFFKDEKIAKEIMLTTSPHDQKALGRKVKGFDPYEWSKVAKDIVYKGSYAKYTQNPELKKELMETEGTTLVEASPYDKIWGIGLGEFDPKAQDRTQWDGLNWLGEVLTELRENLKKEDYAKSLSTVVSDDEWKKYKENGTN